ncbi:D-3-phosphoglycerate dehydrogenase [Caldalkalibacillus uzonensis]|uniref:D-3-phosphoglycerate dehydrogenase n=1 Tax=Caldalkalibacillus uzonensis TaxID=353224 RepID=A0ABU0CN03_9BACI|nr:phosphoglycerate dehydrogenase [Caldalkalibacillus uzonensis]MDQ0337791.1 D-3-phosphoglycerate dehydrogenase [Caldalkalibacillus uzonensis]
MTYKVLVSDPVSEEGLNILKEAPQVQVDIQTGLNEQELAGIIGQYDALIVRSGTQVTASIIERADRLKVIGRAGVGVDNIDLPSATAKGIMVVNAPDGNTISTAEHTFSMLMALARRIPQAYLKLKQHVWDRKSFVGVELNKKTLGIIGLGRIGTEVAKRAKAFNMTVMAYDPYLTPEKAEKLGIQYGQLTDVLATADFITVHTPLLKETRHMISHDQFRQMKDGVYILNCARGGIIDEDALYEAITNGKVAGAALDVFEEEPATHHRLLELDQVIATPHLGASTEEAQKNVAIDVCHEVLNALEGQPVKNAVNLPSIPAHVLKKVEPYFLLSERLGSFVAQAAVGAIKEIQISYAGELTELDVSPLTRNVIKGVLSYHLGLQVNDVNAPYLAKQREVKINEQKTSSSGGFTNVLEVKLVTTQETKRVAGTLLNGYGPRIVKVDQYSIDVEPKGHLVYIRHYDRPGVIGRVGTLLGSHDVNIATMQVGRSDVGGDAIMILTVDKQVSKDVLDQLSDLPEIKSVIEVDL